MKYTEEQFIEEVNSLYNGEIEVVSRYKGTTKPILVKDKYGIMEIKTARQILNNRPNIKSALNQTEYFMNIIKERYPKIAEEITPASEYVGMNKKMLFQNRYGIVSAFPSNIIQGHCPDIRDAIDRKSYFKNQLLFLYDNKYDFEITSTSRHEGRVILICPIHGKQSVDSDSIFLGSGCPLCNKGWEKSNLFYLVRLYDEEESFYKLGISHRDKNNNVARYKDYKALKYNIEELKTIEFEDFLECRELETKLKRLIKNNLYVPKRWDYETSYECFSDSLLPTIINNLNYDIVSTSSESQSSQETSGEELTTPLEEN